MRVCNAFSWPETPRFGANFGQPANLSFGVVWLAALLVGEALWGSVPTLLPRETHLALLRIETSPGPFRGELLSFLVLVRCCPLLANYSRRAIRQFCGPTLGPKFCL